MPLPAFRLAAAKSVIFGDPHKDKTDDLFEAYGEAINLLAGQYIGAQDSGITTDDLRIANKITPHLVGIPDATRAWRKPFSVYLLRGLERHEGGGANGLW